MSGTGPIRVAIVGGGFAGVACARRLERRLRTFFGRRRMVAGGRDLEVTLVARENYFTFQPLLADVIGASIEPRHVVSPIRRLLPRTDVCQCEVEEIDLAARRVRFRPRGGQAVPDLVADHLVLATGPATDLSRVPGLAEHGLPLRTLGDAIAIRNHIVRRLEDANVETRADERARLLTFVVIGAGFSGVEVAGQINDLLRGAMRSYPRLTRAGPRPFRVVLIQKADRILPVLDPKLSAFALEKLRGRGVEVLLGKGVAAAKARGTRLDDGREIETATIVSTVGNTIHPLLARLSLERKGNRIAVDASMRLPGHEGVWAAGDCAAVPAPVEATGGIAPEMAQFAGREGTLLADNILRAIEGEPLRPFAYKGMGQLASLGHHQAVAQVFGLRFGGLLAWWMWRTVYLLKLPGIDRRIRVMLDWTLELLFARDIVELDMRRTERVGRAHYEPGEAIFRTDEPAETFYVVERGQVEIRRGDARVALLGAGEHFGERALVRNQAHSASAHAVTPVDVLTVGRLDFSALASVLAPFRRAIDDAVARARESGAGEPPPLPPDLEGTVGDLCVREVMSAPAVTIPEGATLADALQAILVERRGCLPVVDRAGDLVGIVTRTNVYRALDERLPLDTPLASVLDARAITVLPDAKVAAAVATLRRERLKRLIVVDPASPRRVVGILSRLDLVRAHLARSRAGAGAGSAT